MRVIPSLVLSTAIGLCGCAETQTWDTPYGVPPFHKIQSQHYLPAPREGIRQHKNEIEAIVNTAEPPSFENTIVAMERSGGLLMRVSKVFYAVYSANSDAIIRDTAKAFAPEESAHYNDILMNKTLFERVAAIYGQRQGLPLNSEQQRRLDYTNHAESVLEYAVAATPANVMNPGSGQKRARAAERRGLL